MPTAPHVTPPSQFSPLNSHASSVASVASRSPKPLLPQSSVFPKHRHPVSQAQSSASILAFSCSPHPICQQILTALTSNASGTIRFSSPALPPLLLLPDYAHASHSSLPPSRQTHPTNKQTNKPLKTNSNSGASSKISDQYSPKLSRSSKIKNI